MFIHSFKSCLLTLSTWAVLVKSWFVGYFVSTSPDLPFFCPCAPGGWPFCGVRDWKVSGETGGSIYSPGSSSPAGSIWVALPYNHTCSFQVPSNLLLLLLEAGAVRLHDFASFGVLLHPEASPHPASPWKPSLHYTLLSCLPGACVYCQGLDCWRMFSIKKKKGNKEGRNDGRKKQRKGQI